MKATMIPTNFVYFVIVDTIIYFASFCGYENYWSIELPDDP